MVLLDANQGCRSSVLFRPDLAESRRIDVRGWSFYEVARRTASCPDTKYSDGLERESHRKLAVSRVVIDSENLAEVARPDLRLVAAATVDVVRMAIKQVVVLDAE